MAVGTSARRGRLIKGADVFDRLRVCRRVFLDKTGTVTLGRFAVRVSEGDAEVLPLAAAIERGVLHPIADAIAELDRSRTADGVVVSIGEGVSGRVEGMAVAVGKRSFVERVTSMSCERLANP